MTDEAVGTPSLTSDIACRRCGYNLHGLASDARCPECGTAITESLRGNLLKDADPQWIERLTFGAGLKLWNIVLGIFSGLAVGMLVTAGLPPALIQLVTIGGGALGLWATFAITTQEPRVSQQEDPVTLRSVLRICTVVAFAGSVMQQAPAANWNTWFDFVGGLLGLAGVFVIWGELVYFRRFAERIPDDKLRRSTTLLMWIAPVSGALVIVLVAVSALRFAPSAVTSSGPRSFAVTATPTGPGATMLVPVCFALIVGLYLLLWYVRVLVRYRKAFREALLLARPGLARPVLPPA